MLSRNGSHISTQTASIRFRCRLTNSLRKNSSSVSFFRSLPNHSGSPVSRLHTTVRNLPFLPRYNSSTPMCRNQMADQIQTYLRDQMPQWKAGHPGVETMTVAVMGCVVNGPGESKHSNIGISLPGTFEEPKAPVY